MYALRVHSVRLANMAFFGTGLVSLAITVALAAPPGQMRFEQDYPTLQKQARATGVPLLAVFLAPGKSSPHLSDPAVIDGSKSFTCVRMPVDGKLARKLDLTGPVSVAILDGNEEVLARLGPDFTAEQLSEAMTGVAAMARAGFVSKFRETSTTAGEARQAINSLVQMRPPPADLVPLLVHVDATVAAAARRALAAAPLQGPAATALLDGMASENPALRAACYPLAVKATGARSAPPVKFWQEASEQERKAALAKWRDRVIGETPPVNRGVVTFALENEGKKVGNGECAVLAQAALKAANGQGIRFSGKTYIWGKALGADDDVLPGDIVQLEDARFSNGSRAPHHTQIIKKVFGPKKYEVLEQNVNGRKTVGPGLLDLRLLTDGSVVIYRPQPQGSAP